MRRLISQAVRQVAAVCFVLGIGSLAAHAVTIELKDVAPDRVERQRAAAVGSLPLPGTPDLASFDKRLAAKGLKVGDPVFVRIFKAESELEVWMRSGDRFVLLDTYPICHWSGTIGPKIHEGDKQTPEGFYEVTRRQLHLIGRHPRSLNLGFPNAFDKVNQRTGSYILVHGGCSSVGCFAMTNSVVAEIYRLSERAIRNGHERVPVHVFPFRMTAANMAQYANSEWHSFWQNLKEGYDAFEQTRVPPHIGVCERRYLVQPAGPEEVAASTPLAVCGESLAAISEWERLGTAVQLQLSRSLHPRLQATGMEWSARRFPSPRLTRQLAAAKQPGLPLPPSRLSRPTDDRSQKALDSAQRSAATMPASLGANMPEEVPCDLRLASCRKWRDLQIKAATRALAFRDGQPPPATRKRTAARLR
jgi:murein L,D-transpeptidase YafK